MCCSEFEGAWHGLLKVDVPVHSKPGGRRSDVRPTSLDASTKTPSAFSAIRARHLVGRGRIAVRDGRDEEATRTAQQVAS